MKKLNWLFLTIFSVTFFACSDDDDGVLDTQAPTVTINSPANNQAFTFIEGEPLVINMDFRVEDDFGLDEVSLWVTPPGGTRSMIDSWDVNDFLNDDTEYERDDYDLTIGTPTEGTYVLEIEARDDQGHTDNAQVSVTFNEDVSNVSSISLEGIEEGGTYTIGSSNDISYVVMEGQGVDSVQVVLVMDDDTLVNKWYGEDYFSENIDDDTDFTITDELDIPNAAGEGEHTLIVNVYREGEVVNSQETNLTTEADPNSRVVNYIVTPPAGFDTDSRIFVAGNFQGGDIYTNDFDQGYELFYDETTGTYSRAIYANPDQDINYRYSTIDAEGNQSVEVDEACVEGGEGIYNRSYIYAEGDADEDGIDEINDVDVNFVGYGGC